TTFACIVALPAFSDVCSTGSLASMVGTPCDIAGTRNGEPFALAFTFTRLISDRDTEVNGVTTSQTSPWTAADFNFNPVNGGFTLSFLGGPLSVTSSANTGTGEYVQIAFDIAFLGSGYITGGVISGGALTASGSAYYSFSEQILDLYSDSERIPCCE